MVSRRLALCALLVLLIAPQAHAQAVAGDTVTLLRAPNVHRAVRVYFDASSNKFMAVIDDFEPAPLTELTPLTASRHIGVYWRSFNPLMHVVTPSVASAPEPTAASVTTLLEGLAAVASAVRPKSVADGVKSGDLKAWGALGRGATTCPESTRAATTRNGLGALLATSAGEPGSVKENVDAWRSTITSVGGSAGVAQARTAIVTFIKALEAAAAQLEDAVAEARAALDANTLTGECANETYAVYRSIVMSAIPVRADGLRQIIKSLTSLHASLAEYADGARWSGPDFRLMSIASDPDQKKTITLKLATIQIEAKPDDLTLSTKDVASAVFDLRHRGTFVAEIGAGLVVSNVLKPKFGTSKDAAGQNVVSQTDESEVSYDAGVFLNLLVRVGQASSFVPMIQIGASPDKDAPAVFVGGGARLFGAKKGAFAIAGGLALPWVKTLDTKKLPIGTVVEGTTAIEQNMVYRFQTRKWYFTLQYTF